MTPDALAPSQPLAEEHAEAFAAGSAGPARRSRAHRCSDPYPLAPGTNERGERIVDLDPSQADSQKLTDSQKLASEVTGQSCG